MLTITPQEILARATERFGPGSLANRMELFTWLAGINFALLYHGPCSCYIERLNSRIFDIPADEFPVFATDALDSVEGE